MSEHDQKQTYLGKEKNNTKVDIRIWLALMAVPFLYLGYDAARDQWIEWFPPQIEQTAAQNQQGALNCDFANEQNVDRETAQRCALLRGRR